MAERNAQVLELVRAELGQHPEIRSRALYERAQQIDPSVGEGTVQQFHARYVLPVQRERRAGAGSQPAAPAGQRKAGTPKAEAKSPRGTGARRPTDTQETQTSAAKSFTTDGASDRERIRSVLLQFAQDMAEAESRSEIVRVLSQLDGYVERIFRSS